MTCKKNEIYNACGSLSSEPTCESKFIVPLAVDVMMVSPVSPVSPVAPTVCESGCYCKKGFFRNNKRNCVKEENCISKNLS